MVSEPEKGQLLHRAVRILDCFTREHPDLGVREVARKVGLSSSAAGRLMATMKDLGMLSQNSKTRIYSLGPRALTWAGTYLSTSDIRNVALPYLQDLHQKTQETISLYILDGHERVCIERLESTQNVRFVAPRVGRHLPLHAGSAGKVLLAYLPDGLREEILSSSLEKLTEKTIVDLEVLREELVEIRKKGYALSDGEWILDASGIAAPVFDRGGSISAAITISGPTQRFTRQAIEVYIECILQVATSISHDLGFIGDIHSERFYT
ncbi:MAG TPA: IclR family transcriptional regulator [Anaerolinea sp.]|nr:IclR family transcriptional regulator [Anaerolinea sp.]